MLALLGHGELRAADREEVDLLFLVLRFLRQGPGELLQRGIRSEWNLMIRLKAQLNDFRIARAGRIRTGGGERIDVHGSVKAGL